MADQMINELPMKTAPQTGDRMLMIGADEEYQIDYDKLADAILGKIESKTFALDQGTKSLVAALNELNSNILNSMPIANSRYGKLKEGDDLNNYLEKPGAWTSLNSEMTNSLVNRPVNASGGGILYTIDITGGQWKFQLFILNGSQIFFRTQKNDWKEIQFK